jgi:hypothetical protein
MDFGDGLSDDPNHPVRDDILEEERPNLDQFLNFNNVVPQTSIFPCNTYG